MTLLQLIESGTFVYIVLFALQKVRPKDATHVNRGKRMWPILGLLVVLVVILIATDHTIWTKKLIPHLIIAPLGLGALVRFMWLGHVGRIVEHARWFNVATVMLFLTVVTAIFAAR